MAKRVLFESATDFNFGANVSKPKKAKANRPKKAGGGGSRKGGKGKPGGS